MAPPRWSAALLSLGSLGLGHVVWRFHGGEPGSFHVHSNTGRVHFGSRVASERSFATDLLACRKGSTPRLLAGKEARRSSQSGWSREFVPFPLTRRSARMDIRDLICATKQCKCCGRSRTRVASRFQEGVLWRYVCVCQPAGFAALAKRAVNMPQEGAPSGRHSRSLYKKWIRCLG